MKPFEFNRLTVLFASLLTLFVFGTAFAQWQPDVRLTNDSLTSNTSMNNAWNVAASGDTVHVVWWDNRPGNYEIYYKRSTDNGANWGFDTRLTNDSQASKLPSVAVSGSNVHVVWEDYRLRSGSEIYYMSSPNNGTGWGSPIRLSGDTTSSSEQPSVAVSGSNVHAVWKDERDGNPEIYSRSSPDNGGTWGADTRLSHDPQSSLAPSVAASGSFAHAVWEDSRQGYYKIYYARTTNNGVSWSSDTCLSESGSFISYLPCVFASGSTVHVVWVDNRNSWQVYYKRSLDNGASWGPDIHLNTWGSTIGVYPSVSASGSTVVVTKFAGGAFFSQRSTDNGTTWSPESQLTTGSVLNGYCQSVSVTASAVHMVFPRFLSGNNYEIYYKRRLGTGGYEGFLTEPSQGRHLVRDPARGTLHMIWKSEVRDSVYYTRSTNNGDSWSTPLILGYGKYPTVGLVQLPWMIWPPLMVVSVAYLSPNGSQLLYQWNDGTSDPGSGAWHAGTISPIGGDDLGAPSLVTGGDEYMGQGVFVAYAAQVFSERHLFCNRFFYSDPGYAVVEPMDAVGNPGQPCLSVDGNGGIYGAWQRADSNQIWYAPRGQSPYWSSKLRVDWTTDPSKQPFVECYGDSVFVAWSDGQPSPSDVWRASKELAYMSGWRQDINVSLIPAGSPASESPTQAWREFTTWSEGTSSAQPDVWYYSPQWGRGDSCANTSTWSYWPHSQMSYTLAGGAYLWSAWTESPTANQPPYTVLTKRSYFAPPPPPGGGDSFSGYYSVQAGQDAASPYCLKRDGVIRFADKAVDFARDSLVYELPYLDPQYDYYLRVSSYREAGSSWAQALSVNGLTARSVQFAANRVDTAWIKIPPEAYHRDRKVVFALRKVSGDYVTSLGLTLYQRDPQRGKGGPQSAGLADLPLREVFAVYPNPVNAQAQVEYSLGMPGKVSLSVYNVLGRLVRVLEDEVKPAGVYRVSWDGKDADGRLAYSGVYFMKLNTPERSKTARLVVVR